MGFSKEKGETTNFCFILVCFVLIDLILGTLKFFTSVLITRSQINPVIYRNCMHSTLVFTRTSRSFSWWGTKKRTRTRTSPSPNLWCIPVELWVQVVRRVLLEKEGLNTCGTSHQVDVFVCCPRRTRSPGKSGTLTRVTVNPYLGPRTHGLRTRSIPHSTWSTRTPRRPVQGNRTSYNRDSPHRPSSDRNSGDFPSRVPFRGSTSPDTHYDEFLGELLKKFYVYRAKKTSSFRTTNPQVSVHILHCGRLGGILGHVMDRLDFFFTFKDLRWAEGREAVMLHRRDTILGP